MTKRTNLEPKLAVCEPSDTTVTPEKSPGMGGSSGGESNMKSITVKILNWDKHNPRKDYKRPTWFALSNRFLEDADFFDFTPIELKAVLYIFCQASQKSSASITLNPAHSSRVCNIDDETLRQTVAKLAGIGVVQVIEDSGSDTCTVVRTESVQITNGSRTDDRTDNCTVVRTLQTDIQTDIQTDSGGSKLHTRKKPERINFETSEELKAALGDKWHQAQSEIFPDDVYREREIKKAFLYYADNDQKRPTTVGGWKRKLSWWFDRSWDRHQAAIPSKHAANNDIVVR